MSLSNEDGIVKDIDYKMAEDNLKNWITEGSELYLIFNQNISVGFLRIGYRGNNVAWIEDIFVDEQYRNQGIAAESIRQAEKIIAQNPQYTAICLDVAPKNKSALSLYYKLGYDELSIITIRKEINDDKSSAIHERILGYDFKL